MRVVSLSCAFLAFSSLATAEDKPASSTPKPPVLKLRQESDKLSCRVTVRPGVPDPGTPMTVEVELAEILAIPDPTYGTRRPIDKADLRAVLVAAPGAKKAKAANPSWAAARLLLPLADAGTFGTVFTPPREGVYGLYVRGHTETMGAIDHVVIVSAGVWPLPPNSDKPPAAPAHEPEPLTGDLEHGRALCARHCRQDLPASLPANGMPAFLSSGFAASQSDGVLLKSVLTGAPQLTQLESIDLIAYLRSLHWGVERFFPNAVAFMAKRFTINEHGRQRLAQSMGVALQPGEVEGVVFVAYQGEGSQSPSAVLVDIEDRVSRDRLKKENKLGYLVFLSLGDDPRAKELALALGREPQYPIHALLARDAHGKADAALNRDLAAFVGQGRFNDAKSLSKGPPALRKRLLPVYLRAAELATMYYADERDFTAFDESFK